MTQPGLVLMALAGLAAFAAGAAPVAEYLATRDAYVRKLAANHNPQEQEREATAPARNSPRSCDVLWVRSRSKGCRPGPPR
jgi:hypothetical protein